MPGTGRNPAVARTASSLGRSAGSTSRSTSPGGSASRASPRSRHQATPAPSRAANARSSAGWTEWTAPSGRIGPTGRATDRGAGAAVPAPPHGEEPLVGLPGGDAATREPTVEIRVGGGGHDHEAGEREGPVRGRAQRV